MFLLSDDLSLLMKNKFSFISNKCQLDSLSRDLKKSCTTLWSHTGM